MTETEELMRLTGAALVMFSAAPGHEITLTGSGVMAYSGEALADFNTAFVWPGPGAAAFVSHAAGRAQARDLPMMLIADPEVGDAPAADGLALEASLPLMVLRMAEAPWPSRACEIRRAVGEAAGIVAGDLAAAAFGLPREIVARCWDVTLAPTSTAQTFIAWDGGEPMSAVTLSRHGTTVGVWTMATPPERQGQGWGRALLTQVLDTCRREGVDRAYLYATPAGAPLYRSIGFATVADLPVWVM
jgi:GNAT superfamily N-acetyltransferase